MEGNNLDLSNRGLTQLNEVQGMLSQYSGSIFMLNLGGNYLKYVYIINILIFFNLEILIFKYPFQNFKFLF